MSAWLKGLNPEQQEAVLHNYGPLLILAGAGSGKTTVLVARTGRMITEKIAKPHEICVLTFTNKAARELKHRVADRVGAPAKKIWAGTFHSFGLQILRQFHKKAKLSKQFGIIDSGDSQAILKDLLKEIKNSAKEKFDTETLLSMINDWRVKGQKKAKKEDDEYEVMTEILLPKYLKRLELLGVVDFEDLLLKPLQLLKEDEEICEKVRSSFTQVMVDEFQDTNVTQMELINQLVKEHRNITVVGDDDQSIYGWRGACVSNILDFPKTQANCQVIRLERNYRSSSAILDVANEVIKKNTKRHGKVLRSESLDPTSHKPELFVFENEDEEVDFVGRDINYFKEQGYDFKEIAVLYRSNSQGGLLEAELRRLNIPYSLSGGTAFFDRKEIKDILAFLRCSLAPHEVALRRIINVPARGIGDTSIEQLSQYTETQKISFWQAMQKSADIPLNEKALEGMKELFLLLESIPNRLMDLKDAPGAMLLQVLDEMGYKKMIMQSVSEAIAFEKKWMFVEIFAKVLDHYMGKNGRTKDSLKQFVDSMELRDQFESDDEDKSEVQLLTLHACKGLEYPVVLLIGIEEDILPHRTLGSDIDEERRLFYVGITRAKKRLVMTRCQARKRHGRLRPSSPSRFLVEIPDALLEIHNAPFRPVTSEQRQTLVSDFLKNLGSKIESQLGSKS